MQYRNDGIGESNILQNQFTAYLVTSLKRRKMRYLGTKIQQKQYELPLDVQDYFSEFQMTPDMLDDLPTLAQIENVLLQRSLKRLKQRESYILYAKVLGQCSFVEVSDELGMDYKAVTAVYYRTVKKIRNETRGEDE